MVFTKVLSCAVLLSVCGMSPPQPPPAPPEAAWSSVHPFGRDVLSRADRAAPAVRRLWPELWPEQPRLLIHLPAANQTLVLDSTAPDSSFRVVIGDSVPAAFRGRLFLHDGPPPARHDGFTEKPGTPAQQQLRDIKRFTMDADAWNGPGRAAAVHEALRSLYGAVFQGPWSYNTVFPRGSLNGHTCISTAESCGQSALNLERHLLARALNAPRRELPLRLREYGAVAWLRAINSLPSGGETFMVRYNGTRGAISERAARLASGADTSGYASRLESRIARLHEARDPDVPMQPPAGEAIGEVLALLLERMGYDWKPEVRRDSGSFLTAIARATRLEWIHAPAVAWRAAEAADLPRPFTEPRYSGPPGEWLAAALALYTTSDSTPVKILLPPGWRDDPRYQLRYRGIGGDSLAIPGAVLYPRSIIHVLTPWLDLESRGYPATVVENPGDATDHTQVLLFLPPDVHVALMASVGRHPCGDPYQGPGVRARTGPGAQVQNWANARAIAGDPDDTRVCVDPGVPARAPLATTTTIATGGSGPQGFSVDAPVSLCGNPTAISVTITEFHRDRRNPPRESPRAGSVLADVRIVNAETGRAVWQRSFTKPGTLPQEEVDVPRGQYRVIGRGSAEGISIQIRDTNQAVRMGLEGCPAIAAAAANPRQ